MTLLGGGAVRLAGALRLLTISRDTPSGTASCRFASRRRISIGRTGDERVAVDHYEDAVRTYHQLIQTLAGR